MADKYTVTYKDIRWNFLEREFNTFSEALKYYEEVKKDEDTISADLNIVKPFAVYIKGIRENERKN